MCKFLPSWAAKQLHGVRVLKASFLFEVWLLKLRANLEPAQLPDHDHDHGSIPGPTSACSHPHGPAVAPWGCVGFWFPSRGLILPPSQGLLLGWGQQERPWLVRHYPGAQWGDPTASGGKHWLALLPGRQAFTPFWGTQDDFLFFLTYCREVGGFYHHEPEMLIFLIQIERGIMY